MKKKVAFLINSLSPGGAERVVSILLRHLSSACYDIELILLEEDIVFEVPSEIEVTVLSSYQSEGGGVKKSAMIPLFAYRLAKHIRRERIDLVISFLYRSDFVNLLAAYLTHHRTIVSQRVNTSSTYRENSLSSRLNKFLIRRLYPKADLVLNVSQGTMHDLAANYAIPAARQRVVYNPYERDRIESLSQEPVDLVLPPREKSLIVVAWLRKIKHVALIVDMFARLPEDMHLVIVGSGEEETNLRRQSERVGVDGRIAFVGADKNPYKYMSRAAIYLSASASEGFPNAMVEAMLCRCAVVVSDCPSGPREILAPGSEPSGDVEYADYGVLYPTGDGDRLYEAVMRLLADEDLLRHYSEAGQRRAHDFDVRGITGEYDRIISEVLACE